MSDFNVRFVGKTRKEDRFIKLHQGCQEVTVCNNHQISGRHSLKQNMVEGAEEANHNWNIEGGTLNGCLALIYDQNK